MIARAGRLGVVALALTSATVALRPADVAGAPDATVCPVLDVELQVATPVDPANDAAPQIVAWLEDVDGNYVDTIYITQETGTFGIGNRPGRFDFNSGPWWPYGRRITTFPVWAHRHGMMWPLVVFQDGKDDNLSHLAGESSFEYHFCRPVRPEELDVLSCPSGLVHTDKGLLGRELSRYPPREDLVLSQGIDDPSAEMFATMNPFDAVSRATPAVGLFTTLSWSAPPTVPHGDYVLWVEVSKERDMNATYNETVYPAPNVAFKNYGVPYRGQPSVIYRVPVTLGVERQERRTLDYVGYGDPDGLDGDLREPDPTISSAPGTGAGRLAVLSKDGQPYRVGVVSHSEIDEIAPAAPRRTAAVDVQFDRATLELTAPGDDDVQGRAQSYEIRYLANATVTEATFATANLAAVSLEPGPAGSRQSVTITGLLPDTAYSVGIRAVDNCRNVGELAVIDFTTPERPAGQVDACFVATAAYGSVMAADVGMLRRFRDTVLAKTVFGELAIETYYTFGPALAGSVAESDLLRATARDALAPLVESIRGYRF